MSFNIPKHADETLKHEFYEPLQTWLLYFFLFFCWMSLFAVCFYFLLWAFNCAQPPRCSLGWINERPTMSLKVFTHLTEAPHNYAGRPRCVCILWSELKQSGFLEFCVFTKRELHCERLINICGMISEFSLWLFCSRVAPQRCLWHLAEWSSRGAVWNPSSVWPTV